MQCIGLTFVGLSAPVPRGRKGKKLKKECSTFDIDQTNLEVNPEKLLLDKGYKKHLQRHSNKWGPPAIILVMQNHCVLVAKQ